MKTLEQIQQEVAKEHNCKDWTVLRNSLYGNRIKSDGIWMDVAKRYALEVAKETQRRCAENARIGGSLIRDENKRITGVTNPTIDKSTVLDPKNLGI